jgi:hypothetical protein
MKQRCDVCKHWNLIDNGYGLGRCNKIQEKIEVELDLGWNGGSVKYIETEADFGCNLFESIET